MNPWSGLLRKEFRLGRMSVLIALLAMAVFIGFSFYISWKSDDAILLAMSWMLVMSHILYLPLYIGFSFHREKHTMHHWLHNPLSGKALIAAKLLNGLAAFCVSIFIACLFFLFAWWTNKTMIDELFFNFQNILGTGGFILIHIFLISIYLTAWVLLLSLIEMVTKQKIGKWRGVIAVAIILFGPWLWQKLEGTWLYHTLTKWGAIPLANIDILHMLNIQYVYLGTYVFHFIIAVLLFMSSSWLLDRKVEV